MWASQTQAKTDKRRTKWWMDAVQRNNHFLFNRLLNIHMILHLHFYCRFGHIVLYQRLRNLFSDSFLIFLSCPEMRKVYGNFTIFFCSKYWFYVFKNDKIVFAAPISQHESIESLLDVCESFSKSFHRINQISIFSSIKVPYNIVLCGK